jgi:flagellar motor switch protein FliM
MGVTVLDASGLNAGPTRGRAGRRSRGGGPQPYDFRRPTKLSREQVRTLQMAYETFGRQWSTLLTSTLRVVCQANLLSIEQITYDEYVSGLGNPTCMGMLSIDPLPGVGILEVSMSSAMSWIDHLLGGPGSKVQPQRPLTDIEMMLLRGLLERTLHELRYACEPIAKFQPRLNALEYNPQFAQAAPASAMVIVASFDLRVGEDECVATLCLPYTSLSPHLEAASGRSASSERERIARDNAARAMREGLQSVPVDVAVRFTPVQLTPTDILGLSVGDVLPLGHPTARPLSVTAADVVFAHAVPGAQGKRLACLVVTPPEEETSA